MEPNSLRHGFTLAELLVILLVLALLAFLLAGIPLSSPSLKATKRVKAANYAQQIQTAVLNYYTEYGVYPVPVGATKDKDFVLTDTDGAINAPSGSWGPLMQCLCGMIKPSTGQPSTENLFANDRSIAFLSGLKPTDVSSGDQPLNPLPPDSAALYFNLAVDADYDGLLGDPKTSSAGLLPSFNPPTVGKPPPMTGATKAGVAVWVNCNTSSTGQNSNFWRSTY